MKVIITGATGMVGEGVLHVCLQHPDIEQVLVLGRRSCGVKHPKLKEIIHHDLFNISSIKEQLTGYDACYFCLGITSVGISAEDYFRTTYTLTMHVGETLSRLNPAMTFCYISGGGTDSTENGRVRWARVKGKTENDLMKLPFRQVFAARPGFIKAIKGLNQTHSFYKYISWIFPIGRKLYPNGFCTMEELANSMINATLYGYKKQVLEGTDIIELAKK
ncbi:MAG: NAD-dependent epimerase/dehydratase family protein [Bacteroidota bacterium]|nr:NAD-dependent epimerase/dehydratase family protein [Bacteroidota bacterium]